MMTGSGAPALQRANSPWHVQPCLVAGPWAEARTHNAPGRSSTGLPSAPGPRAHSTPAGSATVTHLRRDARRLAHLTAALGLVSNRAPRLKRAAAAVTRLATRASLLLSTTLSRRSRLEVPHRDTAQSRATHQRQPRFAQSSRRTHCRPAARHHHSTQNR